MVSIYPLNSQPLPQSHPSLPGAGSHHHQQQNHQNLTNDNNLTPISDSSNSRKSTSSSSSSSILWFDRIWNNFFLLLSEKNEHYIHFKIKNSNLLIIFLTSFLSFGFFLLQFYHLVIQLKIQNNYLLIGQSIRLLSSILGCIYFYKLKSMNYITKRQLYLIGNLIIFFLSLGNCLILIIRSISNKCTTNLYNFDTFCNPYRSWNMIPFDILLLNLLLGLLYTSIFKTHHYWMGIVNILLTIFSSIISLLFLGQIKSILQFFYLIFILIVYSIMIIELHFHDSRLFESYNSMEITIKDKLSKANEELLTQLQYNELHHMIGNVAHDMNTPLQALMMELDILEYHVKDCNQHQKDSIIKASSSDGSSNITQTASPTSRHAVMDQYLDLKIQAITQSVTSFKYITSYMSMMINRATDYNKVRNNMPLLPQYSPTNVQEILDYIEGCVMSTSADVPVIIDTLPLNIAPVIMTDRVWLLENLLSLLSNAQKYTTDGSINIRCRLEKDITKYQDLIHDSDMPLGQETLPIPLKQKQRRRSNNVNSYRRPSQPFHNFNGNSNIVEGLGIGFSYDLVSRSRSIEEYILFEVEDTGSGVIKTRRDGNFTNSVDKTEKLSYLPTNQSLRAVETGGGTGIGLYVIWKRLESMGGLFGVKSREDNLNGSCFWFLFPYEPAQQGALPSAAVFDNIAEIQNFQTQSRPNSFISPHHTQNELEQKNIFHPASNYAIHQSSSSTPQSKPPQFSPNNTSAFNKITDSPPKANKILRILVVDDSILVQKAVSRALEQCGYFVEVANHGYQCLSMIEKNQKEGFPQYDVILMDIQMPQLDGIETTKFIRKREEEMTMNQQRTTPSNLKTNAENQEHSPITPKPHLIIGFSANSDRLTYSSALEAGMDTFTSKPLSLEKFHMICESHGLLSSTT